MRCLYFIEGSQAGDRVKDVSGELQEFQQLEIFGFYVLSAHWAF